MNMHPPYFNADQMEQLRLAFDREGVILDAFFYRGYVGERNGFLDAINAHIILENLGVKNYDVCKYLLNHHYVHLGYLKRRGANYTLATVEEIAKKALKEMK